jgi:hypothetical protein
MGLGQRKIETESLPVSQDWKKAHAVPASCTSR